MSAASTPVYTGALGALDRYFSITQRGSTVARELRGGLVAFFAMSYILVLNPLIVGLVPDGTGQYLGGGAEPNLPAIAAATALIAVMPATWGAGFVSYVALVVAKGEARRIHPLMWGVAGAFLVYFLLGPIRDALGV